MKNTIFILLVVLLYLSSCNKKNIKYVYEFEKLKTNIINIEKSDRNINENSKTIYQVIEENGSRLIIINCKNNILNFYDIDKNKKTHQIFVENKKRLDSFLYINKDSIFIFFHQQGKPKLDIEFPGQIMLINNEGQIKNSYSYNFDSEYYKNTNINECLPPTLFSDIQNGLSFSRNILFFGTFASNIGEIGSDEFMQNRLPMFISYNTKNNKINFSKNNAFPYVENGIYYPSDYAMEYCCIAANNNPIIRYLYSSDLFEWDIEKDKIISHKLKSALIDTIIPFNNVTDYNTELLGKKYSHIFYDKYSQQYFSYYNFFSEIYGRYISGVIIADKNYNYLGEIFNNNYYPYSSSKDYLIDYNPYINDSIIELYYLKLKKTNRDYNKYIDSCKLVLEKGKIERFRSIYSKAINSNLLLEKNHIIDFLESNIEINEKNYSVITIFPDGCPNCIESVLNEIEKNIINKNLPLYLINSGKSKVIEKKFSNLLKYNKLIMDTSNIITNLTTINGLRNPRLTVVRDNEIVLDTIYDAFHIETDLIPNLAESLKLK